MVCVVSSWRNIVLETCYSRNYRSCSFEWFGRCLHVCLACNLVNVKASNSAGTMMKIYRCIAEIKMNAKFEDGCGPTHEY